MDSQGLGRTDEILAWDAVAEVWTLVGNLETPRWEEYGKYVNIQI